MKQNKNNSGNRKYLKVAFNGELEFLEWMQTLNMILRKMQQIDMKGRIILFCYFWKTDIRSCF